MENVSEKSGGSPGRLLALDFGARNIGLAVSDELGLTAQGLPTYRRSNKKNDFDHFRRLIRQYAVSEIVMGLPLYGRAWQDKRLARALRFRNVQDLVAQTGSTPSYASELGAWFEYSESVQVKVFYDDARTLREKLDLYRGRGVMAVAFWRIGQGPPELWSMLEQSDAPATAGAVGAALPGAASAAAPAPDAGQTTAQ